VVGPRFPGASLHGIVREERRRVLFAAHPAAPMGCGVGLDPRTSTNYVSQFLSRDFSQRALALAGVKRGVGSYSLHFSRASPSVLPGLALLAPALLPFLPSLLSVGILLTHLLVVSRTPFFRATRWVRVASLSSLPFLSLSFPFFLPTCKDGNGLD
jgi:hypothetical protein